MFEWSSLFVKETALFSHAHFQIYTCFETVQAQILVPKKSFFLYIHSAETKKIPN